MKEQLPDKLFIYEMANNHMGDIEHGLNIIKKFAQLSSKFNFNFAFKMQYRQLDTFIHPDFSDRMDIKYIKRFSETRLSEANRLHLVKEIKDNKFLAICTPFDPESVDVIVEDGFDVIKIASCSFTDWPLLEKIAGTDLPIIASTAGVGLNDIDNVVSFMKHRNKCFILMDCVAEYPTPSNNIQLNQIDFLKKRYPDVRIGYSTHENPDDTTSIAMAIAKGCNIFEKHVALPTDDYAINGYSASPEQVKHWLTAAEKAYEINGLSGIRIKPTEKELASLISLRRGVFANKAIKRGDLINNNDVFMAIPTQYGHITANDWSKYNRFTATQDINMGQAILSTNTTITNTREKVLEIVKQNKTMLKNGNIVVPGEANLEISHHYGLAKFDQYGISLITVVNRAYCKKLIVVLPGQTHPEQYHKKKEETFHILFGQINNIFELLS